MNRTKFSTFPKRPQRDTFNTEAFFVKLNIKIRDFILQHANNQMNKKLFVEILFCFRDYLQEDRHHPGNCCRCTKKVSEADCKVIVKAK